MRDSRKGATSRQTVGSFVALGCVGFIASAPALAQDAGQATRLEGVTVTDSAIEETYGTRELSSPKATASILDTPRIVNVITEEVLEDSASFDLQDALRTVPGITLGSGEGGNASADIPLIRGVDATGDVFVDGVRDIGSQTREVFAVERIEVAKGPSSTLGGRGTAAGAINIASKVARDGNFAAGQVTVGTDDLVRITGDVNSSINEQLSVRVVGMYHDSMVPGRDAIYDDRWGVAPSVTFKPNEALRLTLDYYHLETDTIPDYGIPLTSPRQLDPAEPNFKRPADVDPDNFYGLLARDFQDTNTDAATIQLEAELAPGLVLSNTTRFTSSTNDYIATNPDDSAGNVANGLVWRNVKSRGSVQDGIGSNTNLAAVFETGSIGHSVSLGVEYSQADSTNRAYTANVGNYRFNPTVSPPTLGCLDPTGLASYNCTDLYNPNPEDPWAGTIGRAATSTYSDAEDVSLYVFDTVTITPALLLNGGVRWTDYSASSVSPTATFENEADFWSYQGGVVFKPTENTSLYISYANSRTPPGTTVGEGSENLSNANQLQEPTTNENWEAGVKAELFGGGLLLSGALFRVDRGNIQQRAPTGEVTEIIQAARIQGAELSASGTIGPISMLVGYTYLDSELRDNTINAGNALPQTPEHNLAATIDWQVVPRLSIGAGAYAASERYADAANLIRAGGYVRFDAHAEFDINDNFGLRVNVNNITDERYIAKLRNPHFAVPAEGRQALVSLIARY
jgi:catecholate siderophore receptor